MIEQGTLKDTSASEILLKGFAEDLTGVLYLKREEILKELYLREGKLVWAVSNSDVDMMENILIAENKVDAQTISLLKNDSKNMVDMGKSLVEKGILSFEEFVGYSKDQMDKILTSVLKWSDGVYYFSKDVPSESYISLEINIKEYIYDFIKNKLDMGFVWTRIGSLQEELEKTKDESLIEKYDLSKEELELFDKFIGDLSIEMISLNFPGMAKEDILKTIYFFITAGLLIEKSEFLHESPGESILIDEKGSSDSIELLDQDEVGKDIESIDLEALDEIKDTIPSDFEELNKNVTGGKSFIQDDVDSPGKKEKSLSDQLLEEMKNEEGKKRGKLINYILLLILLLFIVAGIIFVVLSPEDRANLIPGFGNDPEVTEVSDRVVSTEEKKKKDPVPDHKVQEQKKENDVKPAKENIENNTDSSFKKKPFNEVQKKVKKSVAGEDPFEKFRKGKLVESGKLWRSKILSQNSRFSILLEMDCMKVSVMNAFRNAGDSKHFFILNITRDNRRCYLVLFGIYPNKKSAESSLKSVPEYFWKQTNPPKVLDLSGYL